MIGDDVYGLDRDGDGFGCEQRTRWGGSYGALKAPQLAACEYVRLARFCISRINSRTSVTRLPPTCHTESHAIQRAAPVVARISDERGEAQGSFAAPRSCESDVVIGRGHGHY